MSSFFLNIIGISLAISAIILLVSLVDPILSKKFTAKWKYWLWLALAVRLLLPFNISLPPIQADSAIDAAAIIELAVPENIVAPMNEPYINQGNSTLPNIGNDSSATYEEIPLTFGQKYSWLDLFSFIWLGGMIVFWLRQIGRYMWSRKELRRWQQPYHSPLITQLCLEMGLKNTPLVYLSEKASSPMVIGLIRPVVYLPQAATDSKYLYYVLKHEFIHLRRHDIFYKLVLLLACSVHWFNPFIQKMFALASRDLEMICDETVIANEEKEGRKKYSEAILANTQRQIFHPTQLSTYFNGGVKMMKQRFKNIFDSSNKSRGRVVLIIMLLLIVSAGSLFACTARADEDTPVPTKEEILANWPDDIISQIGTKSVAEVDGLYMMQTYEGTLEEIAQQLVAQAMAHIKYYDDISMRSAGIEGINIIYQSLVDGVVFAYVKMDYIMYPEQASEKTVGDNIPGTTWAITMQTDEAQEHYKYLGSVYIFEEDYHKLDSFFAELASLTAQLNTWPNGLLDDLYYSDRSIKMLKASLDKDSFAVSITRSRGWMDANGDRNHLQWDANGNSFYKTGREVDPKGFDKKPVRITGF